MFEGKTAVITGSTSGIGLGIARALAAEGCNVMLNGFGDADEIESIRATLATAHGVEVRYTPADLRNPDEIAAMLAATVADFGAVDILVNNAGVLNTALKPIEDSPVETWDDSMAVNVSAPFHTIRSVLPGMKARNWGRIVNTSSTHGLIGAVNGVAYAASKHAVIGLTKTVALETAETGVTCNAICPGLVRTPFVEARIGAAAERRGLSLQEMTEIALRTRQPSKKLVEIDEIAALVLHLCSDAAASITGAALVIDHGWTAM